MQNNVVYEGTTKPNLPVVIRYPNENDAKAMCDYINTLSQEKTYITYQGEKIELKDEEEYLKGQLEQIVNHESVQLLVFVNGRLSGISSVELGKRVKEHIGVFGISISKKHRGKGLGKLLMELILIEAKENLPRLKIVTLEVMAVNLKGIKMYKKFGFKKYANLPEGNKYKGEFVDDLSMYKKI